MNAYRSSISSLVQTSVIAYACPVGTELEPMMQDYRNAFVITVDIFKQSEHNN